MTCKSRDREIDSWEKIYSTDRTQWETHQHRARMRDNNKKKKKKKIENKANQLDTEWEGMIRDELMPFSQLTSMDETKLQPLQTKHKSAEDSTTVQRQTTACSTWQHNNAWHKPDQQAAKNAVLLNDKYSQVCVYLDNETTFIILTLYTSTVDVKWRKSKLNIQTIGWGIIALLLYRLPV